MEYEVPIEYFIDIAVLNRKSCYTDKEMSVGDIIMFTNKESGGHCKVKITRICENKITWTVLLLYYISPLWDI
jgi:hypothetical protein